MIMGKKKTAKYELILLLFIIAGILLPQLVGTTTVTDTSAVLNGEGYPETGMKLEDLSAPGTRFGVLTGTDWAEGLKELCPEGEILQFRSVADSYSALEAGKIDSAVGFIDQRKKIARTHPDLAFIEEPYMVMAFGFATPKTNKGKALCAELNIYLREIKKNGEYDRLRAKWEDPDREGDVMEEYEFSGDNGTLKVATGGFWTPMTFYAGETLTGEFIEIVNGFCAANGYIPEFEAIAFSAEIMGLASGEYDLVADSVSITPTRQQTVNITEALMEDSYYLLVKAKPAMVTVPKYKVFVEKIKNSAYNTFIEEDRYKLLWNGLCVTISLALGAGFFGTILGAAICFLRMKGNRIAEAFASLYVRIFRGIPVMVLLLVLYYIVFKNSNMQAYLVSMIAFSIDFAAYTSEIFRSGIEAVPAGQARAAKALGFTPFGTFSKVVWPQALIHILPVYSGQFISMVKLTSVAGSISVIDLTKASEIIRSRTYEAFFPLFLTATVYILLSALLMVLLRVVEKRIDPALKPVRREISEAVENFDQIRETRAIDHLYKSDTAFAGKTEKTEDLLLTVRHLKKSFENVTPIKDLNCDIHYGDAVAIIGPSGTGKSTFLNLINRLEEPDAGEIFFEGEDTRRKGYDLNKMREKIGMVFQSFNLFMNMTVIENVMLAQTELLKRSSKEAAERSMELLQMVGMADKALSLPSELSGGQQQRAAIVRTLAMDPHIILFDEPTSALDPTMVGEVQKVIKDLADGGMTMLIVTHEMRFARDVSNRVFFLDEGVIYEEGTPEQVFESPQKEKTRQFINHLQVFKETLGKNCDFPALMTRIEQFGFLHMIDRRAINNVLHVIEELCLNTILRSLCSDGQVDILIEYSDEEYMDLTVTYEGADRNPL